MSSEGRYDSPSQISLEKQTAYKILMRQGKAASPEDVEKLYRGEIGFVYTDDNPEEGYLVVGNNQSSIKVLDNTIVLQAQAPQTIKNKVITQDNNSIQITQNEVEDFQERSIINALIFG